MVSVVSLWLPILLSAVAVFVASSVIHMFLGYHKSDYRKLPSEDAVMDALRPFDLSAGDYHFPRPDSMEQMKSPAFREKVSRGPTALMTVYPKGPVSMGNTFVLWILYCIAVGVAVAYVSGHALLPGAACKDVVRFTGATAFCCYAVALWQQSIWYRKSWMTTLKANVDGVIYAALTAGIFCWLWPR